MVYLRYYLSVLIWQFFNPFGLWQSLLQNAGQVVAILRLWARETPAVEIAMSLPVKGKWAVVNGGVDRASSHSWNLIAQRYAYDLLAVPPEEKKVSGKRRQPSDYFSFGQEALAPADGVVVQVRSGQRDCPRAGTGTIDMRARDIRGNFVVIRHAERVYSLVAHLQKNSCAVRPGETVKRGQVIGRCGNSGHSTEPHVHFQLQDHPNFYLAVGLPVRFADIRVRRPDSGEVGKLRTGYISRGSQVENLASGEDCKNIESQKLLTRKTELLPLVNSALNTFGLLVWAFLLYAWLIRPALAELFFVGN